MVAEIHLANIYFTDVSASKIRPILLLKVNSFGDVLYLPLTTNIMVNGFKIDSSNLREGLLPKTSVVVHEKPGVIAKSLLIKKIGTLHAETHGEVMKALVDFIQK